MERRLLLLKFIAAGFLPNAASQQGLVSIAAAATSYQPQFFSASQMDVLDRLTELIIPEDDYSSGAHAAEVNVYLDVVMSEANNGVKQRWCEGLAAAGEEPTGASTRSYPTAAPANWTKLSPPWPQTSKVPRPLSIALDRFFPLLKRATIDGYYTSKIGIHEDLQYQGNTAVSEFPGCTHKEH